MSMKYRVRSGRNPVSSVTRIIRYYRSQLKDQEPWKIDHEVVRAIFMMEDRLSHIIGATDALMKIDIDLHKEAIHGDESSKIAQSYKKWSKAIKGIFIKLLVSIEKMERFADKVGYFDGYKEKWKYIREDFTAIKHQLEWVVVPEDHLKEILRSGEEVKGDSGDGECGGRTEAEK